MDFKRSCFPLNVSSMTVGNKLLCEFYHTGKPNIRFFIQIYINLYHFVSVGCKKGLLLRRINHITAEKKAYTRFLNGYFRAKRFYIVRIYLNVKKGVDV